MKKLIVALLTGAMVLSLAACGGGSGAAGGAAPADSGAGSTGAAAPAAIGWISDLSSVRIGFCVLVVMAAILTFAVVMNMMLVRKKR